jgi:hypothetical protein
VGDFDAAVDHLPGLPNEIGDTIVAPKMPRAQVPSDQR